MSVFSQQENYDNSPSSEALDYFSNSNVDRSFHSVMTPWEMEFKEGKLQKKRVVRTEKNRSRNKKKR